MSTKALASSRCCTWYQTQGGPPCRALRCGVSGAHAEKAPSTLGSCLIPGSLTASQASVAPCSLSVINLCHLASGVWLCSVFYCSTSEPHSLPPSTVMAGITKSNFYVGRMCS
jgi:hypothetical protein